jgi:hypothetical protein
VEERRRCGGVRWRRGRCGVVMWRREEDVAE